MNSAPDNPLAMHRRVSRAANCLPEDRLIVHGRTHTEMWRPERDGMVQRMLDDNERAARRCDRVILALFVACLARWAWEVFA